MTAVVSNPLPTMLKRCSGALEVVWSFALLDEAQPRTPSRAKQEASARWRMRKRAEDMDTSDVELPSAADHSPGGHPKEANGAGDGSAFRLRDSASNRKHPILSLI